MARAGFIWYVFWYSRGVPTRAFLIRRGSADFIPRHAHALFTGSMVTFVREVHTYVRSLPLLLYHKKDVVRILLHHLAIPESSSRAALLDLLSTLARDLRQEFYPFFGDIMPVLVSLINPESPEELERVFSAFAYLFKFLIKNLLRDVEDVFTVCQPNYSQHEMFFFRALAVKRKQAAHWNMHLYIFLDPLPYSSGASERLRETLCWRNVCFSHAQTGPGTL